MSGGTGMLWRTIDSPPHGGLMRFAHCAKRACTLPTAYRKLTDSRRPGRNSWNRGTPPKRVSSPTARVASSGVVTSWDTTRIPSRSPHNHVSLGLTRAGGPISFNAVGISLTAGSTSPWGTLTPRRFAAVSVRPLLTAILDADSLASAVRPGDSSRARYGAG